MERQYGIANANFCEYVLERLEVCIDTCSNLHDHVVTSVASGDEEVIEDYRSNIHGLIECLRCVQGKWLEYEDIISSRADGFRCRYKVEITVHCRGRPRFNIRPGKLDSQFIVPARTLFREIPKNVIFHYN